MQILRKDKKIENYISILEQIARRELIIGIFGFVLCIAIVFGVWGSFIYRITKKTGKKRMTNKKKRERKRDIKKSIAVNCAATVVMFAFTIALFYFVQWDQNNYKKDIEQKSFETYQGEYYIETNTFRRRTGFLSPRYVVFENRDSIRLDSYKFFEIDDGEYTGTVVYAKHSNLAVYIDNDKPTD